MSTISLSRLCRMTRDEVSWRARQAARIAAQRTSVRMRAPRWQREDLRAVLADGVLDGATRSIESRWHDAHAELARQICARTTRFALDPAAKMDMRAAIRGRWPAASADAATGAGEMLAGRYDLLGYRGLACATPGGEVDWHFDPVHDRRAPLRFWADVPYLDPSIGDHKIIWELNRHQHWLRLGRALWLTGDQRYRRTIIDQFYGWLAANPPLVGINWASMLELGLRAISWTWALHFLLAVGIGDRGPGTGEVRGSSDPRSPIPDPHLDPPWLVDLLVALDRQLGQVEQNLSLYFSPNTHLTGEALALYVVGVALPELASSARWADAGRAILLAEIDRQIHADGGHAERSTHYQRYTLDFYLMALITARRDGDGEAASRFADAAARLADFTRQVADDRGLLPLIGDDDGGMLWPLTGRACRDVRDSLAVAAALLDRPDLAPWGIQEEVFWLAGRSALEYARSRDDAVAPSHPLSPLRGFGEASRRTVAPFPSCTLADTGYVVFRDPAGSHAVFDVGLHGYLNAGHAHADALSLTLTLAGRPLLVDAGTSTYTIDARLRDRLRSSISHNTVTLEDRSPAIPAGPFHWRTRADARLHACRHNPAFDWAEASHDGYAPTRHRRTVLRTPESGWLIVDEILGIGRVTASAHWHFDPAWTLRSDAPGRLKATDLEGDAVWLLYDGGDLWLVRGDEESGLGWHAPVYGTLRPTWTARVTRCAAAPVRIVTWLAAADGGPHAAPRLERVAPAADPGGAAIGVRVTESIRTLVFLLRPGEPSAREGRGCAILDYQTDARLLHYSEAGPLLTLALVDASHALALRDGWISVVASVPAADLHVALGGETLDLHTSEPPPQLRLQGSALERVRRLRLNEREMPPPASARADAIVICSADWPAGTSVRRAAALRFPSIETSPSVAGGTLR